MKIISKFELDNQVVSLVALDKDFIKIECGIPQEDSFSIDSLSDDAILQMIKKQI